MRIYDEKSISAGQPFKVAGNKASMDIIHILNTVGKRTFVNCFEARKSKGGELGKSDITNADSPDSEKWSESSLHTKTSCFNRIFRESREREALQICCEATKLSNREKALKLYKEYY